MELSTIAAPARPGRISLSPITRSGLFKPEHVERVKVSDRASWLEMRKRDVTASAIGALLGVHEYVSAYELYHLKAGTLAEDPEETQPMRRGRLLEPVALKLLREERPRWNVQHAGYYYRDPRTRIGATPDALATDPDRDGFGVVQIKSVEPGVFRQKWRAEGEVEPPTWIAVQALVEATLCGASWAVVTPLVVGHGLELPVIEIPLHRGLMERLELEVAKFWDRIERNDPPPPDYAKDGAALARVFPSSNGQEIDLSGLNHLPELVDRREALKAEIKDAEREIEVIDTEFKHRLGQAELGLLAGGRRVSWKVQTRKAYEVKAATFRALRFHNA